MLNLNVKSRVGKTLAVLLSLFLTSTVQGQATDKDWGQFLGPNRDSISSETGILKDWSGKKLKLNWTLPVGEGYAIGSVSGGKYFHFDVAKGDDGDGGDLARLRCIDMKTADVEWTFTAPSSCLLYTSPSPRDGLLSRMPSSA